MLCLADYRRGGFAAERRGGAQNSWEVTQVNEMLTWMECHPLPFICTTNLVERLDKASMRRFTFKSKFDFLTEAQSACAFAQFFNLPAPDGLRKLDCLTPGDFAVVRRRADFLGEAATADALLRMLGEETAMKGVIPRRIGF